MSANPVNVRTVPPTRGHFRFLVWPVIAFIALETLKLWKRSVDPHQAFFIGQYVRSAIATTFNSQWHKQALHYQALYETFYHAPVWRILWWPLTIDILAFAVLYYFAWKWDNRKYLALRGGKHLSGPVLHKPRAFERTIKGDGVSTAVAYPGLIGKFVTRPRFYIHIPQASECEHWTISGSPGSGKTTQMQWFIDSAIERSERTKRPLITIFFDPHCLLPGSFIRRYYKAGDWIANPYDVRGFSWCPTWELDLNQRNHSMARARGMANSLYVGKQSMNAVDNSSEFFTRTAQLLFTQLVVDHQPSESQELAYWLDNPDEEICTRVTGKLRSDLDPGSAPQRNGIISTVTMPQQAFEAIPRSGEWKGDKWRANAPCFTVRDYCLCRDRNLFLTATADTIEALHPYYGMLMDMIFRQLMSMGEQPDLPDVLIVLDEADALPRLPMLQKAMNQARKFNVRIMLGFQSRSQLDDVYGEHCATSILSASKTQIYHRTGDNKAADWESRNIGEIEYEELQESFAASLFASSKNRQVRTEIKRKFLFKPSDFMGLEDREAIMRFENEIVKFRAAILPRRSVTDAFIPRADIPVVKSVKRPIEQPAEGMPGGSKPRKEKKGKRKSGGGDDSTTLILGMGV